jgi:hypothetical protein
VAHPARAFNQDLGIYLAEANATQYPGNILDWKESGGFAGTYSPHAAFVQTVVPMNGGTTYHLKPRWKTNKNTNNNGRLSWPGPALAVRQRCLFPEPITAQLACRQMEGRT